MSEVKNMMLEDTTDMLDNIEITDIAQQCVKLKEKEDEVAELEEKLKAVGAELGSSVSKNTFVVVVKSTDETTGKTEQAQKLQIPIMTSTEFALKYI